MAELRGTSCVKHDEMYSCFMGCLRDQCCLAVKLSPQCEISYIHTEALDIVKEVTDPPPADQCSCAMHVGGTGGNWFSFKPQYVADPSPIVRLTLYTRLAFGGMNVTQGVGMKFKSGEEGSAAVTDYPMTCDLEDNEHVTRVTAYNRLNDGALLVVGLQVETTLKTCGTFGAETDMVQVVEGHQLIYFEGKAGSLLDGLDVVFAYGCTLTSRGM